MPRRALFLAAACVLTAILLRPPGAAADAALVDAIIGRVDSLYRADASHARLEMTIVNPNWQRTLVLDMWTRGLRETFLRIQSPRKDAGITTLRRGTEMWNYFPRIDKVMKVPPSMMMSSWMGSDFTNDDLVKESTLTEDYAAELIDAGDGAGFRTLRLTAGEQTATVWPRIDLRVNADDWLPVEEIYFDEHGQPMRRILFSEVRAFGDRTVPATMELVPLHKEGHRTVIRYLEADFDVDLEDDVFSLRHLQSRR